MLAHAKDLLEYQNGMVAIHPRFNKLITALRTAVENGESALDKEATSHVDPMDAYRMSLLFWHSIFFEDEYYINDICLELITIKKMMMFLQFWRCSEVFYTNFIPILV